MGRVRPSLPLIVLPGFLLNKAVAHRHALMLAHMFCPRFDDKGFCKILRVDQILKNSPTDRPIPPANTGHGVNRLNKGGGVFRFDAVIDGDENGASF